MRRLEKPAARECVGVANQTTQIVNVDPELTSTRQCRLLAHQHDGPTGRPDGPLSPPVQPRPREATAKREPWGAVAPGRYTHAGAASHAVRVAR